MKTLGKVVLLLTLLNATSSANDGHGPSNFSIQEQRSDSTFSTHLMKKRSASLEEAMNEVSKIFAQSYNEDAGFVKDFVYSRGSDGTEYKTTMVQAKVCSIPGKGTLNDHDDKAKLELLRKLSARCDQLGYKGLSFDGPTSSLGTLGTYTDYEGSLRTSYNTPKSILGGNDNTLMVCLYGEGVCLDKRDWD